MIKLENTEVLGWEAAIRGMRNPMNSWEKSDSIFMDLEGDYYTIIGDTGPSNDSVAYRVGEADHKLMMNLAKAGSVDAKFRRMIVVTVDITAPLYWWKEFDTYKVGTVANSCSTMHKIHDKMFTREDFSCEHLDDFNLKLLDDIIFKLNANRHEFISWNEHDATAAPKKHYWWQMIQLLPSSYNQRRTVMLNYEVLAGIYPKRKDHKLDEWHVFCDWINSLPYSEIITLEDN